MKVAAKSEGQLHEVVESLFTNRLRRGRTGLTFSFPTVAISLFSTFRVLSGRSRKRQHGVSASNRRLFL